MPHFLLIADIVTRTRLSLTRLEQMGQWWHWPLAVLVVGLLLFYVIRMYLRDSVELPAVTAVVLTLLRIATFLCLGFVFLGLEKKTEQEFTKNSRVFVLVDTSQSMGLPAELEMARPQSRLDVVRQELEKDEGLLNDLRRRHEVIVARFDQDSAPEPVAMFAKLATSPATAPEETSLKAEFSTAARAFEERLDRFRLMIYVAGGLLAGAALCGLLFLLVRLGSGGEGPGVVLLAAVFLAVGGLITAAVAGLADPSIMLAAYQRWTGADELPLLAASDEAGKADREEDATKAGVADGPPEEPSQVDWRRELRPQGMETRLADNLVDVVNRERGGPLAGVVLFSDGGVNAGIDVEDAAVIAADAKVPIYTVGLGSDKRATNIRIADIEAPKRVYPEDKFVITGFLQQFGVQGYVTVRLSSALAPAPGADPDAPPADFQIDEDRRLDLPPDDDLAPIRFEIETSEEDTGRRVYTIEIVDLPRNKDADPKDNAKSATVEIVERRNRVLLFADGPTREYRFVRNLLYRDKEVAADVLLQNADEGISQEADEILDHFPTDPDELFEKYDCIMAFDADFSQLSPEQAKMLDRWVAEKAGGLILIGGRIHTPEWAGARPDDMVAETIQALCPVVIDVRRGASAADRFASEVAWPLEFTEEGRKAEFLWLADSPTASEGIWNTFDGVYGYYPSFSIRELKPGATAYAVFTDPQEARGGVNPAYLAGQFYGAGRVLFIASGEFWRLRELDEKLFETIYTKLIRQVSEGRLLRDSSRGLLMVSKERCMIGETINVRAQLTDARHEPLTDETVTALLTAPDDSSEPLELRKIKDAPRQGLYAGQFVALYEGDYRVNLPVPQSDGDLLARTVRTRIPELEIENPQRDDRPLKRLADATGGEYRIGMQAATSGAAGSVTRNLLANDVTTVLPDTPDVEFNRRLSMILLGAICGLLSLEWIIRRLSKLA